jgi:hypothetical protein
MNEVMKVENVPMPISSVADIERMGEQICKSGMFGIKNPAQGAVVVATCHSQNITIMDFFRTYHLFEDGRPSMRADAMGAEFRRRGGKYKIVERTPARAAAEFTFEGQTMLFEHTIEMAERMGETRKKGGDLKDNWKNRPENMLWARMISNAIRVMCPEVCAGLYTPEEVSDFEPQQPRREKVVPVSKVVEEVKAKAEAAATNIIDLSVCPGGKHKGQRWEELETSYLQKTADAANTPPEYKKVIEAILNERALSAQQ